MLTELYDEYLLDEDGWTCPNCGSINSLEEYECIYCDKLYDFVLSDILDDNYREGEYFSGRRI